MTSAALLPFTEADLNRLEELLDDELFGGEAMLLDELQALLCAIISSPQPVPPSVWLPLVFGEQMPTAPARQLTEITELLLRFHNDLVEKLATGEDWELILYPLDDDPEELDFATWADAYIYGSQLGDNWYDAVGDHAEQLTELLQPIFLLSGILKEDARERGEPWMSPSQEKTAIDNAQDDLPGIILALHDFWRAKRQSDEAISEEQQRKGKPPASTTAFAGETTPLTDENCPCGSGLNYKQCCGRPERLH